MAILIVEDGTGVVTGNAYATVEEVDAILETNIYSNWSIADADTKVKLVMWATRLMEERIKWNGRKLHETAWLSWPRCGVHDKEGFLIPDDIVPRQVKIVCALICDHLLAGNPELFNSATNLTKLQVDVIQLQFDARLKVDKYPVEIKLALAGLGRFIGMGGPKYIVMH